MTSDIKKNSAEKRRNNSYIGQTIGKYLILGRSDKQWSGRHGFIIKNIETGEVKEVSRPFVYILKRRVTDKSYLSGYTKKKTDIAAQKVETEETTQKENTSQN